MAAIHARGVLILAMRSFFVARRRGEGKRTIFVKLAGCPHSLLFPVSVRSGAHSGDSLRAAIGGQLQPTRIFATRLSVNGRLDATTELEGEVVRASGGASVHVAPELVSRG